jgi:hypothetical protein
MDDALSDIAGSMFLKDLNRAGLPLVANAVQ